MGKILFRGKRLDNGKWTYGYVFDDGIIGSKRMFVGGLVITDYVGNCDDEYEVGYAIEEVDHNSIGQFTGLCDKNNVRIFEGDIVRLYSGNASRIGEVKFGEIMVPSTTDQFESCEYVGYYIFVSENESYSLLDYDGVEVIGNIYDNPELLEEKEN